MQTKYTLNIQNVDDNSYSETLFATQDINELKRFLHLAGVEQSTQEGWIDRDSWATDTHNYGNNYDEPIEVDYEEDGYIREGMKNIEQEYEPSANEELDELERDLRSKYETALHSPKGSKVECPNCGRPVWKKHPKQAFCSNSRKHPGMNCKDQFRNRLFGIQQKREEDDLYEDEDDRDDTNYDYGDEERQDQIDQMASGDTIDKFTYTGYEEAQGLDQRLTNNYGNNAMAARMSESHEECDCPDCQPEMHAPGCDCPTCGCNDYEHPKYDYQVDDLGNVMVYDNDDGRSTYLQGTDALETLQAIENAGDDARTVQVILRQCDHLMENREKTLYTKLLNEWKNEKKGGNHGR